MVDGVARYVPSVVVQLGELRLCDAGRCAAVIGIVVKRLAGCAHILTYLVRDYECHARLVVCLHYRSGVVERAVPGAVEGEYDLLLVERSSRVVVAQIVEVGYDVGRILYRGVRGCEGYPELHRQYVARPRGAAYRLALRARDHYRVPAVLYAVAEYAALEVVVVVSVVRQVKRDSPVAAAYQFGGVVYVEPEIEVCRVVEVVVH